MQYVNVKEKYQKMMVNFQSKMIVEENNLNFTNVTHQVWIKNK